MSSHGVRLTLRQRPHLDWVAGYPGLQSLPSTTSTDDASSARTIEEAALKGTVEVGVAKSPVRARWLKIELKKTETIYTSRGRMRFFELIGSQEQILWTAEGKRDVDADGFSVLQDSEYPFSIPIPPGLPPSATLDKGKGTGIVYHLVATLRTKSRSKTLFVTAQSLRTPVDVTQLAEVLIEKHELNPAWPQHFWRAEQETNLQSAAGIVLQLKRDNVVYGAGDPMRFTVTVSNERTGAIKTNRIELVLREVITSSEAGLLVSKTNNNNRSNESRKTIQQVGDIVVTRLPIHKLLFSSESTVHSVTVSIPSGHYRFTVQNAKHFSVHYHLRVRAVVENPRESRFKRSGHQNNDQPVKEVVLDGIPVIVSPWSLSHGEWWKTKIGSVPPALQRPELEVTASTDMRYNSQGAAMPSSSQKLAPAVASDTLLRSLPARGFDMPETQAWKQSAQAASFARGRELSSFPPTRHEDGAILNPSQDPQPVDGQTLNSGPLTKPSPQSQAVQQSRNPTPFADSLLERSGLSATHETHDLPSLPPVTPNDLAAHERRRSMPALSGSRQPLVAHPMPPAGHPLKVNPRHSLSTITASPPGSPTDSTSAARRHVPEVLPQTWLTAEQEKEQLFSDARRKAQQNQAMAGNVYMSPADSVREECTNVQPGMTRAYSTRDTHADPANDLLRPQVEPLCTDFAGRRHSTGSSFLLPYLSSSSPPPAAGALRDNEEGSSPNILEKSVTRGCDDDEVIDLVDDQKLRYLQALAAREANQQRMSGCRPAPLSALEEKERLRQIYSSETGPENAHSSTKDASATAHQSSSNEGWPSPHAVYLTPATNQSQRYSDSPGSSSTHVSADTSAERSSESYRRDPDIAKGKQRQMSIRRDSEAEQHGNPIHRGAPPARPPKPPELLADAYAHLDSPSSAVLTSLFRRSTFQYTHNHSRHQ